MQPLALVAGFFGAGKTRFLTSVIPELQARGLSVRVLLNDFETAEVDTTRLATLSALVTPLSGECVCCSSLEDLLTALAAFPPAENSVTLIEANGATKTEELLGALTTDRRQAHYTLPLQVTIVDAKRWQKRWWHNDLEANQARTATHVHVNWTHRVPGDRLSAVQARVRTVNPNAKFTAAADFADDVLAITNAPGGGDRRVGHADSRAAAPDHTHGHGHQHGHSHAHTHEHPFASVVLGLPDMVRRDAFAAFVGALPRAVVRAKGLVRFADRPETMFVWNRVDGRKRMTLDESAPHASAAPMALFIGVGLPVEELRTGVESLRA
ncbi:MAG: hypothetical protein FJ202_01345 [Gemmatimonadetes bacterium]|nr:hypothetical protein [Gemmatimonadota bacterium]